MIKKLTLMLLVSVLLIGGNSFTSEAATKSTFKAKSETYGFWGVVFKDEIFVVEVSEKGSVEYWREFGSFKLIAPEEVGYGKPELSKDKVGFSFLDNSGENTYTIAKTGKTTYSCTKKYESMSSLDEDSKPVVSKIVFKAKTDKELIKLLEKSTPAKDVVKLDKSCH